MRALKSELRSSQPKHHRNLSSILLHSSYIPKRASDISYSTMVLKSKTSLKRSSLLASTSKASRL